MSFKLRRTPETLRSKIRRLCAGRDLRGEEVLGALRAQDLGQRAYELARGDAGLRDFQIKRSVWISLAQHRPDSQWINTEPHCYTFSLCEQL